MLWPNWPWKRLTNPYINRLERLTPQPSLIDRFAAHTYRRTVRWKQYLQHSLHSHGVDNKWTPCIASRNQGLLVVKGQRRTEGWLEKCVLRCFWNVASPLTAHWRGNGKHRRGTPFPHAFSSRLSFTLLSPIPPFPLNSLPSPPSLPSFPSPFFLSRRSRPLKSS